jgi:hypothetical protein
LVLEFDHTLTRGRILSKSGAAPRCGSPGGTTLDYARFVVEQWKKANNLPYFSPRAADDLAERIEPAMRAARDGLDG